MTARARHHLMALAFVALPALIAALATTACGDPVHDREVAALGDEKPGVPTGPTHRPGQPCLVCHGGSGPGPDFTLTGTIYLNQGEDTPAVGATVHITSGNGETHDLVSNSAGNFYVSSQEFIPTYPLVVTVEGDGVTQKMGTHVGRDGSCSGCHIDPQGPTSPGRVYLHETPK
ncbi:MAG: hypothetical protein JWM74_5288 [Myxococcaceae bacterium]|nr:hypothetical protein [Myxococcaceae bacterium]